jgi:hypothetical protein
MSLLISPTPRVRSGILGLYILAAMVAALQPLLLPSSVEAAQFSQSYIRYDRMAASTATNTLVVFTVPAGNSGTEEKLVLTWPAGFTIAAGPTTNTTGLPAGVTALPGTLSAGGSGQVITISGITDLTASTQYGVNIATGVTTHGTPGQYVVSFETQTSGAAQIDTGSVATRVISDDQIVVTATVPPTFDFTLSGNTDSLGTLGTGSVSSSAGRTVTVVTNATNGWIAWVKDLNAGLNSATASYTIPTAGTVNGAPSSLSAGTNGYVLDVDLTTDSATAGTGTVTVAGEYNGTTTSEGGTLDNTAYQPIVTANGPTDTDVVTLIERAAISGLAKAATNYTDTLTVVGAGNF